MPFFNLGSLLQYVAAQLLPAAASAAGLLLFQTPAFTEIPDVRGLWLVVLGVTDTMFVLALLFAGGLIMTSDTFQSRYTAKLLIPRLLLAALLANASLVICSSLTHLDNALVVGILGQNPATNSWGTVTGQFASSNLTGGIVFALVAIAAAVMGLFLAIVYIARDLLLLLLTVLSPLALATYGVPGLDEMARLWWRGYLIGLFVQVGDALLLRVGTMLLVHPGWLGTPASALISSLMLVALLYVMFKLPFVAYKWVFRHPVSQNAVVTRVRSTVNTTVTVAKTAASVL
jgi:hypothetical protein